MSNEEFRAFGVLLGDMQPERSPEILERVDDGVILNIVSADHVDDVALQPFGMNSLSLHSESSGRPPHEQPRLVVLMCISSGDSPTGGQTVVVSMRDVHDALDDEARALLSTTSNDQDGAPPYLRYSAGQPVFAVRDFLDAPMHWLHWGPIRDHQAINDSLVRLLTAMYTQRPLGSGWTRGGLMVIDNFRHFHGRTAAQPGPGGRPRHLRRLRIATPSE